VCRCRGLQLLWSISRSRGNTTNDMRALKGWRDTDRERQIKKRGKRKGVREKEKEKTCRGQKQRGCVRAPATRILDGITKIISGPTRQHMSRQPRSALSFVFSQFPSIHHPSSQIKRLQNRKRGRRERTECHVQKNRQTDRQMRPNQQTGHSHRQSQSQHIHRQSNFSKPDNGRRNRHDSPPPFTNTLSTGAAHFFIC